jgi:hypothetical protein
MKKSTMMLTGGATLILLILITLVSFFRFSADRFIDFSKNPNETVEKTGIIESKEFNLKNFDSLIFSSVWDVTIVEGEQYKIRLSADKAILNELQVKQSGNKLEFFYDKYLKGVSTGSDNIVKAEIIMPELKEINFSGLGNLKMSNFSIDTLKIVNSGASNIEAENVVINQLNLFVNGAANAELSNIDIKNCYLDISGAANIELNMAGGKLTGKVSGAADVVYSGIVAEESVIVSGIGSLKRK